MVREASLRRYTHPFRFKRRIELEHGRLDLAPLIDVVFLLLIFFMLTSSFMIQPSITINLPKAVTSTVVQEQGVVITVTGENVTYFQDELISLDGLAARLETVAASGRSVLIKADQRASLGRVVDIWDVCREVGVTQINIATNRDVP